MIPVPRGPGDLPVPPEKPQPAVRRGEPGSLVLQAFEEIEALKQTLSDLVKRLESLEHRMSNLEPSRM